MRTFDVVGLPGPLLEIRTCDATGVRGVVGMPEYGGEGLRDKLATLMALA